MKACVHAEKKNATPSINSRKSIMSTSMIAKPDVNLTFLIFR
jgi:hypothetical protein